MFGVSSLGNEKELSRLQVPIVISQLDPNVCGEWPRAKWSCFARLVFLSSHIFSFLPPLLTTLSSFVVYFFIVIIVIKSARNALQDHLSHIISHWRTSRHNLSLFLIFVYSFGFSP